MTDKTIPITLPASTWAQVLHALDNSPSRDNYLVHAAREHIRQTIRSQRTEPTPIRPSPMVGELGRRP